MLADLGVSKTQIESLAEARLTQPGKLHCAACAPRQYRRLVTMPRSVRACPRAASSHGLVRARACLSPPAGHRGCWIRYSRATRYRALVRERPWTSLMSCLAGWSSATTRPNDSATHSATWSKGGPSSGWSLQSALNCNFGFLTGPVGQSYLPKNVVELRGRAVLSDCKLSLILILSRPYRLHCANA